VVYDPVKPILTVNYGGFDLGEANGIILDATDEHYRLRDAYHDGVFSVQFVVRLKTASTNTDLDQAIAEDNAAFAKLLAAVETALRRPRQRLVVSFGNQDAIDWNPAVGAGTPTAFHAQPELEKIGAEDDSLRAQRFKLTLRVDHPADLAGQNGRALSDTQVQYTLRGRRVVQVQADFTALDGKNALDTYQQQSTEAWFQSRLPAAVANGEWVMQDALFNRDDEDAALHVTRIYVEVVNGLRESDVRVTRSASQALTVTIAGVYTKTAAYPEAKDAHDNFVELFCSNTLKAVAPGANFDMKPRRDELPNTTGELYAFTRIYEEIVSPQSPAAVDDENVTGFSLFTALRTPFIERTITNGVSPEPLQVADALYEADLDKTAPNGIELKALWDSKYKAHCTKAVQTKLGATQVILLEQRLGLDLTRNRIQATLEFLVRGPVNVLALLLSEEIDREVGVLPVPLAKGKRHAYFLFDAPGAIKLTRIALCEYVAGTTEPKFFTSGDTVSGISLTDTGRSFKDAADAIEAGTFTLGARATSGGGWIPRRQRPKRTPSTSGQAPGISTVKLVLIEEWLYATEIVQAPSVPGQLQPLKTVSR
jgi:hypothetical protein